MSLTSKRWLVVALAAIAIAILAAFELNRGDQTQYFTAKVERGDIREVVEATGTINAVITVQVGSQVSGTISELHADFNSRVKKGQVIARIDPSLFEGTLLQAKADLQNARANAVAATAELAKAQATANQMQAQFERSKALAAQGVVSQQQLDVDRANAETAVAAVAAAKAQVLQANAQVSQKAAAVTVAQTNLDHTVIRAPIDGTVVSRNVDVGQTVAASLQAPVLFVIAQDLTKMQVYAKTDESDVGQIKAGQVVTFKVDAFPQDVFQGRVEQVRMDATTVQNVVTYDTIIGFDNPDLKLFPGMTAYVTIPVAVANNVLKVPNGALRYKPDMKPDEIRKLYAKYGLQNPNTPEAGPAAPAPASTERPGGGIASAPNSGGRRGPSPGEAAGPAIAPRRTATDLPASTKTVVWKLRPDKTLEPIMLRLGITDHTTTAVLQVLKGTLSEGELLITGSSSKKSSGASAGPGLGGAPTRGR